MQTKLQHLASTLTGELLYDSLIKTLYATDASVYRELPLAVAYPKSVDDIKKLILFCKKHKTSLIPRAAGTSLAGQCVGDGIVVDISKHFTQTLQFNKKEKTIVIQPGVIRDELNEYLAPYNLFFGPNTSTSNRCMLGGMVGNNSSGTTSIQYGVTRDKVIEIQAILSDGSEVVFGELSKEEFQKKMKLTSLEGEIYRGIFQQLSNKEVQSEIIKEFPKQSIHRRNTGYAVDALLENEVFGQFPTKFNLCKLLTGSEGTLAFTTQITLQLDELPPSYTVMVAAQFKDIQGCLNAVAPVMKHNLFTCEMMDKVILDCTKNSLKYKENRFFIEEDPAAILMLELRSYSENDLENQLKQLLFTLMHTTESYANAILKGEEITLALELRKAGLGLLGNMEGDKKAVACIEDTAVAVEDLAPYIEEFTKLMDGFGQKAVYYAHAGAGELHLRPILNLKDKKDVERFREITYQVSLLVKKYRGSLSGEHGDGRVRAEFIELMVGKKNHQLFAYIKQLFDPENIFNPGKIVEPKKMDTSLRYEPERNEPVIKTQFNYEKSQGILRAVEKCNGSGDCRKGISAGGTMCPSYRATKNEKDSTRARANALREFLTHSNKENKFNHKELKEVLDLCISCKGCKSECPSNVDMATYKAEFEYQYKKANGSSLRTKLFAHNHKVNSIGSKFSGITNALFSNKITSGAIKSLLGVAQERSLPKVSGKSFRKLIKEKKLQLTPINIKKTVYLFIDEFTEYLDSTIGIDAVNLLVALGYEVKIIDHPESGRSHLSRGFLKEAKKYANENINLFKNKVSEEKPLVGIEPSAILSFRDEYIGLAENREVAEKLSKNVFLVEEFISSEIDKGNITSAQFTKAFKSVKIHGHCHQKALSNIKYTFNMLNLPENYKVTVIPSGCCGMAGSFGYEKEHYAVSMQIGNQTLFPAVTKSPKETLIAANGTSCRHQIKDGTQRTAKHPISILWEALEK